MKKILPFLVVLLVSVGARAQEEFPYLFYTDDTVVYQPLSGGNVLNQPVQYWDDTLYEDIPIGFDLHFAGRTFDKINYNTNGYISFGEADSLLLMPFNTDLVNISYWNPSRNSEIKYRVSGSSPNRRFTLQVENAGFYDADDDSDVVNFQVILEEKVNNIRYHFGNCYFTTNLWIYAPQLKIGYQQVIVADTFSWRLYGRPENPSSRKLEATDTLSYLRPFGDTLTHIRYTFEYTENPIDTGQEWPEGISEKMDARAWALAYPNPFSEELHIYFSRDTHWALIDLYGNLLLEGEAAADTKIQPGLQELPAGTYLLQLRREDEIQVLRVLKY